MRIKSDFLNISFDLLNMMERKIEEMEGYKEILRQLEQKEKQIIEENDKEIRANLIVDLADLNIECYNFVITGIIKMVMTKDFMYEDDL